MIWVEYKHHLLANSRKPTLRNLRLWESSRDRQFRNWDWMKTPKQPTLQLIKWNAVWENQKRTNSYSISKTKQEIRLKEVEKCRHHTTLGYHILHVEHQREVFYENFIFKTERMKTLRFHSFVNYTLSILSFFFEQNLMLLWSW